MQGSPRGTQVAGGHHDDGDDHGDDDDHEDSGDDHDDNPDDHDIDCDHFQDNDDLVDYYLKPFCIILVFASSSVLPVVLPFVLPVINIV